MKDFDFDLLFNELENGVDILDNADIVSALGFTKDQARFVNTLIVEALKKYHKTVNS